jgi:hypothetical protein
LVRVVVVVAVVKMVVGAVVKMVVVVGKGGCEAIAPRNQSDGGGSVGDGR